MRRYRGRLQVITASSCSGCSECHTGGVSRASGAVFSNGKLVERSGSTTQPKLSNDLDPTGLDNRPTASTAPLASRSWPVGGSGPTMSSGGPGAQLSRFLAAVVADAARCAHDSRRAVDGFRDLRQGHRCLARVPGDRPARHALSEPLGRKRDETQEARGDLLDHVGVAIEVRRLDDVGVRVQGVALLNIVRRLGCRQHHYRN